MLCYVRKFIFGMQVCLLNREGKFIYHSHRFAEQRHQQNTWPQFCGWYAFDWKAAITFII